MDRALVQCLTDGYPNGADRLFLCLNLGEV